MSLMFVCLFVCLGRDLAQLCQARIYILWPLYWQYWTFLSVYSGPVSMSSNHRTSSSTSAVADGYPHRISTFVPAWNFLAGAHANTSTVKYSGPAFLPRKSQAARNRGCHSGGWADSCLCIQWWQWPFLHAHVHLQGDTYMPLKTFVHILLFMPQLDYRWSTKFIIAHISC